ncbi:MAG: TonB-dependent receptor [Prevotellaceae bacterium]|nr:TonB-dependent receptor [Prevotellaceae bacterium]
MALPEITVTNVRENRLFKEQPLSFSSISSEEMDNKRIENLHDLSTIAPNFFMPDYGSKITSSIYVRGIGSRMNEPSVGLYVDGIPYLDKSAFDFDFYDIQRIDLLRGPQGVLYGRNSIGGLINIQTLSVLDVGVYPYAKTNISASLGNANYQNYKVSHYRKITEKLGISLSGYYNADDGFFVNQFNGKSNRSQSFGGRGKLEWKLPQGWKTELTLLGDKTNQIAYPYAAYDTITKKTGEINYNEENSYQRDMWSAGLTLKKNVRNFHFSSATGFQYLNDQMKFDNDCTADSIFTLTQKQKQRSIVQEFIFRSNDQENAYQWVAGLFGFYKKIDVDAPMTFRRDALHHLGLPAALPFISRETTFPGIFKIPTYGLAGYHQSSYTFFEKLTLTAGLRLEYEKTKMDYFTSANMIIDMGAMAIPTSDTLQGNLSQEFWQFLPKIALKYDFNQQYNIYASVSKGYKTGGFNFQFFSDILQNNIKPGNSTNLDAKNMIPYKPESTINYEIGTHSELIENKLFADIAVFYIDYRNQQIVTFASTNTGSRRMENAGKSESAGAEASLRGKFGNFSANINYGYTYAAFKKYNNGQNDYSGNRLPLVPENTLSVAADYTLNVGRKYLNNIVFAAQYNALGKMFFTEENNVSQDFYGTLNGKISFGIKHFTLSGWIKNALNEEYNTFYFTSLNRSFVQQGKPRQFGISLQCNF